ncbi:uncharacterized protein LOC130644062 [Hydractinia symbiolongicarpus]|uniref:uncharacterized protein LOC130644062 n=1 Tax=Hydractinia symbiolongicarpus TaxID=13093 RepID=UPI00254B093A|nr:uncharacterized protein LOC130644062 [Hydractinia symbiolongicarpus]
MMLPKNILIVLMVEVIKKVDAYPQCVKEDGIPVAARIYSRAASTMNNCLNDCYRYQMEHNNNFYNGISYQPNVCRCLANMTDIIPISPNGTKTCFFGPRVEELSLTLLELPKQYEIEAGTTFEHVFSMSYTNMFNPSFQTLNIASMPNKKRRPSAITGVITNSKDGYNLPSRSGGWNKRKDDFGVQYQLWGHREILYLVDEANIIGNHLQYATNFEMGDSSEDTDILFVAFIVKHRTDYGISIRHAFMTQMQGNDQSRATLHPLPWFNFNRGQKPFGYTESVSDIQISNEGNATGTNYTLELLFPSIVNLKDLPEISFVKDCGSGSIYVQENALRLTFQYLAVAMNHCKLNLRWKTDAKELKTTRNNMDYYIYGLVTYCPYRECNSVDKRAEMEEFKWAFRVYGRNKLDEYKQFRIKNVNNGRCWDVRDDDYQVEAHTKCQTEFKYTSDNYIVDANSGRKLALYAVIQGKKYVYKAHVSAGSQLYYTHDNHIVHYYSEHDILCVMANGTEILRSNWYSRLTTKCPSYYGVQPTAMKILEGWDDYNLDMRSVLKATTPLGETIFICNPGGDKGNKYNCFYSNNSGNSWTAMDALITNIRFYSASSESIYGTMNRGNSFFQLLLAGGGLTHVKPLSEVDYNAVLSQETNIHTQAFNNVDLTEVKVQSVFGSDVQVSSHGVYVMVNAVLKKVFAWGY